MNDRIKVAILDLNAGVPNQGLRCISEIVESFGNEVVAQIFDVRSKSEVPSTDFDIYIGSGGPGHPLEGDGIWDKKFYDLIQDLWDWNARGEFPKKYFFFICHSFQMACNHFAIGEVTNRKSESFGIFPVHKTEAGKREPLFMPLNDPFFGADFRNFQVVQPDRERLDELGAEILALEKIRPHVKLERAIMAVRFSDEFVGVQFHPEADPQGMIFHFTDPVRKAKIIDNHGAEKYYRLIKRMKDPDKLTLTHNTILPSFISNAIQQIREEVLVD
jgi:GMP synthase-like glutamine amidotransferase